MYGLRQLGDSNDASSEDSAKAFVEGMRSQQLGADDECDTLLEDLSHTLKKTIEGEIIPRLMLSHQTVGKSAKREEIADWQPSASEIAEFASIILNGADDRPLTYIGELQARGVQLDAVYIGLLAPTARLLGEMWVNDRCHFVDVTIGLARLQQLLHSLTLEFNQEKSPVIDGQRAVFSVSGNEQHTYGMLMVAEFFRRDGWDVWCGPPEHGDEMPMLVNDDSFDVIGFSLSRESLLETLKEDIAQARRASKNPSLRILVGGRVFSENTSLVHEVGADIFAHDAKQAIAKAQKI